MKVFEFHFNPGPEEDLIFDSYCYEPENNYEGRLGGIYMVGLLKNAFEKNERFLDNLAKTIREKYYSRVSSGSPEKSLRDSLKTANEYLEKIAKRGDVSWLGNLNFAVLSLKDFNLNFTKVGRIKIFLLRAGRAIDIDKKLNFQEIEPYPLKIFGNTVSGKLAEDDAIMVLTEEVLGYFRSRNLIAEIANLPAFNEKEFKKVLDAEKEGLQKISGICLAMVLKKGIEGRKETIFPRAVKEFSLKEAVSPLSAFFKKIKNPRALAKAISVKPKAKSPKLKITFPKLSIKFPSFNKNYILIGVFVLILAVGAVSSQVRQKNTIKKLEASLQEVRRKVDSAEGYLTLNNSKSAKKANTLLKESYGELSPIITEAKGLPREFSGKVASLEDEILDKLYGLNKFENIGEPKLVFEFKADKYIPERILPAPDNGFYFFSPYSKNLFALKENGEQEVVEIDKKLALGSDFDGNTLFLAKPGELVSLKGREFSFFTLPEPYPDFDFNDFSAYRGNLYFLDEKAGQIIKYSYYGDSRWSKPEMWLKRAIPAKAMAADGSIWVLEKNNAIDRYYAGALNEKIELDIFPAQKVFSKIYTSPSLPYLYILEPQKNRIIVISKKGEIIKQYQSEKFDNLLDFAVTNEGKEIYLLNGLKVYKIETES